MRKSSFRIHTILVTGRMYINCFLFRDILFSLVTPVISDTFGIIATL